MKIYLFQLGRLKSRLKMLCIFILIFFINEKLYAQKITLSVKNENIENVFKSIKIQTGYNFIYTESMLHDARPVTITITNSNIKDALDAIFKNQSLDYTISNRTIVLKERSNSEEKKRILSNIVGVITDEKGNPLNGVTISVENTNRYVTSDTNGNYKILVEPKQILKFSLVGYREVKNLVENSDPLNVKMENIAAILDDIIVVGYGTQKKASTTAAISTLKGKIIANNPVVNMSNSLTGRVAGVIVTQGSGEPGQDGGNIHIRGIGTTGNNAPLIVVDGIYRDFAHLDPNSIESVTVLKDAAAVAPYGLAGANGVILVTTKKGKSGTPTLSYNGYIGIQNPTRMTAMVNSYQYALMQNEAAANQNSPRVPYSEEALQGYLKSVNGDADADIDKYPNSNGLKDLILNNRILTTHNIELSGGSSDVKYYTSIGYTFQEGQWKTTSLKRYNLLTKIDAKATKTTNVVLSVSGWIEDHYYPGRSAGDIMYQAFRNPPVYAIKYSNGDYGGYQNRSLLGEVYESGYKNEENTQIMTNLSIEQKLPFVKGLSVKAMVSYDPYSEYYKNWQTPATYYTVNTSTTPYEYLPALDGQSQPLLIINDSKNKAFTYQGYLNYNNSFGKSRITFLGVAEFRNQKYRTIYAERDHYNLDIDELDAGSALSTDIKNSGSSSEQKQVGYLYRLNYSYNEKYVLEAIGRYDGHYYFAPGHRYGFFPTFGFSWNISEENFIKNNYKWIDALKLRTSYGQSGNLAGGAFQYLSAFQLGPGAVFTNNGTPTATQGVYESAQPNHNITWERQKQFDVGLEGTLLKGAFTFELDYFHQKRNNMLVTRLVTAPAEYGIGLTQENFGIMSNQGFDITLGTQQHLANGINWGVTAILSYAKNKLLRVDELAASYNNPNTRQTGRPLGTAFGYKAIGYFQEADFNTDGSLKEGIPTQPWGDVHPGDIRYADLNGDGKISTDYSDKTKIGNSGTPQIQFSLNPTINWNGLDLNLLFQGATLSNIQIGGTIAYPFDIASSATLLQFNNHWTPTNTNAIYPRLTSAPVPNNQQYSTWYMRNNTYIRLKSAQLGYTISEKIMQHIGIASIRVYLAAQNLWTWTPHMKEILDPEAGSTNGQYYFQQQVVSFGLNVTF